MQVLKQSTAIKVRVGPFMDITDAVTPETTVALGTADQAEALKADGAATADISAATWAAITGCDGWYDLSLTTSHTDTVGTLDIVIQDASLCLPVFARFQVVEEATYDALFGASAAGFNASGAVTLAAATHTGAVIPTVTTTTTATNLTTNNDKTGYALSAAGVDAIWDEVLSKAAHDVAQSAGKRLRAIDDAFEVHSGTAQAGAATTITLDTGASATDDIYRGDRIIIVGGTGAQEHNICTAYNGTTKVATVAETWVVTPDATSEFEVVPASVDVETVQHTVQTAGDLAGLITGLNDPTAATIAAAVVASVVETNGSITLQQAQSIILAAVAGVTADAGATLKDPSGTTTRIAATINGSNERTAMTVTPSS